MMTNDKNNLKNQEYWHDENQTRKELPNSKLTSQRWGPSLLEGLHGAWDGGFASGLDASA